MVKKVLKAVLTVIIILLLIVAAYVGYVFLTYDRLDDNLVLDVNGSSDLINDLGDNKEKIYSITSWNMGFAAYTDDYGFFMDGGTESRAWSKDSVISVTDAIAEKLSSYRSDFYFIQEVDTDSTRSYHVNEYEMLIEKLAIAADGSATASYTFGQNYDSAYLCYPILQPIGASKSGVVTLSRYNIESALRRSLPIQTNFAKVLDLDRCYVINRVPMANGKELILINFHLSAYTTDPTIVNQQIEMLYEDMIAEYKKGNYIIAGGDFNKDLLGDSSVYFKVPIVDCSWAKPYPFDTIPENFNLVAPLDVNNPVPSCRNADGPWDSSSQIQLTIDGFLTSDNIEVVSSKVVNENFKYSDHNPVQMRFKFK